jgi:hypothetical protein
VADKPPGHPKQEAQRTMTTQNIASSRPLRSPHRRLRTAAAVTGAAALIATGGYLATTDGPDAAPSSAAGGTDVNPSAQVQRELRESVADQYGSRSAPDATVNPSDQVQRDLRASIAGQYGPTR